MPNCCTLHILPFQLSLSRFIFILLPTTRINHGSSLPLTEPWKKKKPSESLSFFLLYYSGEPHRKSKFEPIWDKTPFGKRSNFFKKQILLGRSPLHKDYNDTSHHTYNYMKNRVKYKLCDQGLFSSMAGSDYFGECLPLQALSFYLQGGRSWWLRENFLLSLCKLSSCWLSLKALPKHDGFRWKLSESPSKARKVKFCK